MPLRRTELLNIQSITGIATVGILTVGTTQTAGGVGIASTTYIRGVVMHNTGIATATSSLYIYPSTTSSPVVGFAITTYRIARVDLASNETFFFETNYPIVLTSQDKLVVEVGQPSVSVGGVGIGSVVNYLVLGDTDI
jgi:hypothetical protein